MSSGIIIKPFGDWARARHALGPAGQKKIDMVWRRALLQEARFWHKQVVQGITKQAPGGKRFKKLSPLTRAKRRAEGFAGRKALIRTATLRRNIALVERSHQIFIGVLRGTRTSDGKDLVNIARVHEEGRVVVIKVTEKMRKYFYAMMRRGGLNPTAKGGKRRKTGGGLARGVMVIQIPARPFIAPVYAKMTRKRVLANMKIRIAKISKGTVGLF